ncbi:hypothetical protein V5O48_008079 [Marasmius crinis-equi]|uniref:Uncharacterized protein n=1 Tax=Marasmius crinis-equi TaxID=585013 RepID=A0ABR3FEV7_9AGAR
MVRTHLLALFFGLTSQVAAAGNQTIDDSSSDFTFSGSWQVNSCSKCSEQPESGQAFNQTYHTNGNGVSASTARLQFTGSAIWVYGILAPSEVQGGLTITLDSQSSVVYNSSGNSNSSFTYNELFFHASSLSTFTHTLTLKTGPGDSGNSIILDYAVVNTDFATSTP